MAEYYIVEDQQDGQWQWFIYDEQLNVIGLGKPDAILSAAGVLQAAAKSKYEVEFRVYASVHAWKWNEKKAELHQKNAEQAEQAVQLHQDQRERYGDQ